MPFKFVTGTYPALRLLKGSAANHYRSWYVLRITSNASCDSTRKLSKPRRIAPTRLTASQGFDARFPNQNQTKHCWQNYVDYHKCILAKGEDFKPCRQVRISISHGQVWN